jgi:hypothetical protein
MGVLKSLTYRCLSPILWAEYSIEYPIRCTKEVILRRAILFTVKMNERERQMLSALANRYGTGAAEAVRIAVQEQCQVYGVPPAHKAQEGARHEQQPA